MPTLPPPAPRPGSGPVRQPDIYSIIRQIQNKAESAIKGLAQEYTQTPAASFTIKHGRGRTVGVQAFDNTGLKIPDASLTVQITDPNTITLTSTGALIASAVIF